MAVDPSPKPVYVFDGPRTCSQVFGKMWMAHPDLEHVFMNMMGAAVYGLDKNIWRGRQHCEAAQISFTELTEAANGASTSMFPPESYESQATSIEGAVAAIQARGKTAWVKDHTFCVVPTSIMDAWLSNSTLTKSQLENPTPFTTGFLDSVTPVFLFRHPALTVPSWLRKIKLTARNEIRDEDFQICTTLYWTRLLLDSYLLRRGIDLRTAAATRPQADVIPLVIETQDFIVKLSPAKQSGGGLLTIMQYNTDAIIDQVCNYTGVAKHGVQYEWQPTPEDQQPPSALARAFFQDMFKSTGIQRAEKPAESSLQLAHEFQKWIAEFGRETAEQLLEVVEREMENYEYLQKFKFQVT